VVFVGILACISPVAVDSVTVAAVVAGVAGTWQPMLQQRSCLLGLRRQHFLWHLLFVAAGGATRLAFPLDWCWA